MPRNGSGTFTVSVDFATEAGAPPIEISKLDSVLADIGSEMTNSLAKDGQTLPTANLPMNGMKHTNVSVATARSDYACAADVMDQDLIYFVDSGAADAYVITPSPAITAYEEGQRFVFRAINTNTATSTLNVNALGTRIIYTADGSVLPAGAIAAGGLYEVTYDANPSPDRWILTSMPSKIPDGMLSSNVPLKNAGAVFTGIGSGSVAVELSNTTPRLAWNETDAAADNKLWYADASGEQWSLTIVDDARAVQTAAIRVNRTGTTVDSINLSATSILFNSGNLAVAFGGTGSSTASAARTALGVAIGSDVQAWDANLDQLAALAVTDSNFVVGNGSAWVAETGATARTSLGLGSLATLSTINDGNWSGTDLAIANGGTGASDAATARTNLGAAPTTLAGVDFTGLTTVAGNALVAGDDWLVMDDTTVKRIQYSDNGMPVETVAGTTDTIATANMNTFIDYTSATAVTVTLNTGVGVVGNCLLIKQSGTGQVTVSGTATRQAAIGSKTRVQHSVISLICIATNTWAVFGDCAA